MIYFKYYLLINALCWISCSGKKTAQTQMAAEPLVIKVTVTDSIESAIAGYDRRLDIKMKRKRYEPQPGTLVTLQKWFEFGDTTRLLKLREETLTDSRMDIAQYHFINGKLAEIHDYIYNKKCTGALPECMDEAKYFFNEETLVLAQKRHAEGTPEHTPVIEQVKFAPFQPDKSVLVGQHNKLIQINTKYASLPYPKPRPERGTPVLRP